MIDKNNLKDLLTTLGFQKDSTLFGNVFTKHFDQTDCALKADFEKELLIYPEDKGLKVNERHTCNFSANENFVVFECVHRLLEKGYKPEHLELEPKWKLGHGASGGRADILVRDNNLKSLLIIECKTEGREFDDAWKDTQLNGGQLFGYLRQEGDTQFICLYTSDFKDNKVDYQNYIITATDIRNLLEQHEGKENKPLFYKDAKDTKQLYQVWKETYKLDYKTNGIFDEEIQPYNIGKQKYTEKDLKTVVEQDNQPKYHEFATILRQHNVSGRENAFDKLVNLFLCKIVDEKQNPHDLRFYWKGEYSDNYFDLIDRLQRLYKIGMDEFLGEEVTYVDNKEIDEVFSLFQGRPNAIQRKVKEHFRKQKYFTNNDFSFIDVHNERLFYQNAGILLKVVKMWQDIRLNGDQQNQFLGDMFEGFLDQGIKQSEGQFFTPMPITKFILMSLPLENWIKENEQIPKAIDYACGSGHFLTELASQIKPFVIEYKDKDIKDYYAQIYGIEKEYRLSKVAKLSAFMYSQDQINILYADALAEHERIRDEMFSLLVANPPFSVKGFLETLPEEERNRYALSKTIEPKSLSDNNSIETFFIERAKQLLASDGIAGIIVPSSILSNSNRTYIAAREILLQYFDIIAITELGSGTFGKTGTNTVVLFLRRKTENPPPAEHYKNRVNDWFDNVKYSGKDVFDDQKPPFLDECLIKKYCDHIEISFEQYQTLFFGKPSAELLEYEIFKDYRKDFDNSSEIRNLRTKKFFKELNKDEKQAETDKRFLRYVIDIEKDKLYYFVLAYLNPQKVVIVKSPSDNKEQKQFLGYEWSAAKGSEGIKLIKDAKGRHLTPLYDADNRYHPEKINSYIQQNFSGQDIDVPEILQPYLSTARLVDMLDFSRKSFDKQISLAPKRNIHIESKWALVKLGDICEIIAGQSPDSGYYNEEQKGIPFYQGKKDFGNIYLNSPVVWTTQITKESVKDDLLMSVRAPVGDININPFEKICIGRGLMAIRPYDKINRKYLFEFIAHHKELFKGKQGATFESIARSDLMEIKIPVPIRDVQAQLSAECEVIDTKVSQAQAQIEQAKKNMTMKIETWFNSGFEMKKIEEVFSLEYGKGLPKDQRIEGEYPVMGSNGIDGYHNNFLIESPAIIIGRKGSAGKVVYIEKNCYPIDTTFYLKLNEECSLKYLFYVLLKLELDKMIKGIGVPGLNRNDVYQIQIPVPAISIQQALVSEIEKSEAVIKKAQAVIDCAAERKQAVMKRYL